eukprot:2189159-Lingulodinium_polyedra.AAC.1
MDSPVAHPLFCNARQLWLADHAQLEAHLQGKNHRRRARANDRLSAADPQEVLAREAARGSLGSLRA